MGGHNSRVALHVHADGDTHDEIEGVPHTHEVARLIWGKPRCILRHKKTPVVKKNGNTRCLCCDGR